VCTENSILAPRIHGELLKLGFEVAQSTVSIYMVIFSSLGPPEISNCLFAISEWSVGPHRHFSGRRDLPKI
jgi:hypothetical protein